MIGNGCMIGGGAATGKGVQLIGRVPIIGERRDVTDGLIHRWKLTENANDAVGTLNLTNNGGVTFSAANGASLNGSTQYLNGLLELPTSGTLSLWVRPSAYGEKCLAGWGLNSSPYAFTGLVSISSNVLSTYYKYSGVNLSGKTYSDFPTSGYTSVVLTWNGTILKTYIDGGKLSGDAPIGSASTTAFAIGAMGAYAISRFAGYIKDARVYTVELSDSQIAVLADNGPNP